MADITNQQVLDSVNKTIQGLIDVTLTKEDGKNFLTKEDAKQFLTKEDGKKFLTKDDAKQFATKDDLTSALKDYPTKKNVREIVREEVADIRDEQLRQGVLLEDMDDKIAKLAEVIDEDLTTKKSVKDHEERMSALEIKARMLTSTVRDHSAQIKNLKAGKSRPLH